MDAFTLSPTVATILFVAACLAGFRYRAIWKAEGPRWQLWFFGIIAASTLLLLGFVPVMPA
ncbi:MAG: hypothetical protein MK098_04445 [Marinovum sp.]|nr:hypothetical protein [Marinovum sp.]